MYLGRGVFGGDADAGGHKWISVVTVDAAGPQGFFYDEWVAKQSSMSRAWLKISATAENSGRVTESFLNGERKRKTAEQFANRKLDRRAHV